MHLLCQEVKEVIAALTEAEARMWMYRVAGNHVVDFLRAKQRLRRREASLETLREEDERPESRQRADPLPLPQEMLMRVECRRLIDNTIKRLNPTQQFCFLQHYLYQQPVQSIATTLGRTSEAVYKILARSRRQLQAILQRQGTTEADLREYLTVPAR